MEGVKIKGITQDFVWGVLASLLVVAVSIIIFKSSNLENIVYNLILILMGTNLIITSYYVISISKMKLKSGERRKELVLRLKILRNGKEEAKKSYYNRKISEDTFNRIVQNFEQEEIMLKSELESLKSK